MNPLITPDGRQYLDPATNQWLPMPAAPLWPSTPPRRRMSTGKKVLIGAGCWVGVSIGLVAAFGGSHGNPDSSAAVAQASTESPTPAPTAVPTPVPQKTCYLDSTYTTITSSFTSRSEFLTITTVDDTGGFTCADAGTAQQGNAEAYQARLNSPLPAFIHVTGYDFMPAGSWHLKTGVAGQTGAFYQAG